MQFGYIALPLAIDGESMMRGQSKDDGGIESVKRIFWAFKVMEASFHPAPVQPAAIFSESAQLPVDVSDSHMYESLVSGSVPSRFVH
jgi:hypothetical protein